MASSKVCAAKSKRASKLRFAYPGVVATRIRYHGYNAAGNAAGSSGLKEDDAMSIEECARLIIQGMEHGKREVVMTGKGNSVAG
jgi:NaMN:DMB phosphoribosyltransferase